MRARIVYLSKTGNTAKVAKAMGEALGLEAEPLDRAGEGLETELLFLGCAVYATYNHDVDPLVKGFIASLEPSKVGLVVLFCTGFQDRAIGIIRPLLERRGLAVAKDGFFCRGRFLFFNFAHPGAADLEAAKAFARRSLAEADVAGRA
jgi:flavodoxin